MRCNLRLAEGRLCVLVVIGAREQGRKEWVAVVGGYRESAESGDLAQGRRLPDQGRGPTLYLLPLSGGALAAYPQYQCD